MRVGAGAGLAVSLAQTQTNRTSMATVMEFLETLWFARANMPPPALVFRKL